MKPILVLCVVALSLSLSAFSLGADLGDASKLPPPAKKSGLTYGKDVAPILEKSCLNCHGPEKPKSKYRVDSLASMIKGGSSDQAAIVPRQSAKSPLVHYVADLVPEMEMPPLGKRDKYPKLTSEQVSLFRAWIDQGAK